MRKLLLFLFINTLFSSLIAIKYFLVPGTSINLWSGIFSLFAVLGQFFIIYLLISLICIPLLFLRKSIQNLILATLFGFCQIVVGVDTLVFEQYRFHLNQSVISLVFSGQVVDFSFITYLCSFAVILIIFFIELYVLRAIDKKLVKKQFSNKKPFKIRYIFIAFIFMLLSTNIAHMIAAYYAYSPIIVTKEYIPYYYPLTSKKIMGYFDKDGQVKNIRTSVNFESNVNYPLNKIIINSATNQPNILFIVVDSWRFDTFSPDISPKTYQFVKKHNGIIFNNHYSTGNATRTGVFGLLYGIPGTYWQSFFNNSIPSTFITTLQEKNYNIGIFSSAKISAPEFDRTAFVTIDNLRINSAGNSAPERDQNLTKDWLEWYQNRDIARPTFSFLFYDTPHSYEFLDEIEPKFKPYSDLNYIALNNNTDPLPIFNRYKNSVYSVDYILQNVFDELESTNSLDNTIIVITGDHAQEMNDNKMGFWGHNGNYTDAQTKVPFIIIGTKNNEAEILAQNADNLVLTSHEDVVPSIMKHYLNVTNDIHDYSTGYDLFSPITDRNWLLMSNYSSYAIRTQNEIYLVNSVGISHYMNQYNQEIDSKPNYKYIHDALDRMNYFYVR